MSEQLEIPRPVEVMDPSTGEVIRLDSATDVLARFLDDSKDLISRLQETRSTVGDEVIRRMDREGKWSAELGGYKLSAPSPAPSTEYDVEALYSDLTHLALTGVISTEARDRAVSRSWTYKASVAGINALAKLPGVAEVIERHARKVEKTGRRVSVSLKRSA